MPRTIISEGKRYTSGLAQSRINKWLSKLHGIIIMRNKISSFLSLLPSGATLVCSPSGSTGGTLVYNLPMMRAGPCIHAPADEFDSIANNDPVATQKNSTFNLFALIIKHMAKTLRNIVLSLIATGAFLLAQKAKAQDIVEAGSGGKDTVYAVNGSDSAQIIYWSGDGTSRFGALQVDGIFYLAKYPKSIDTTTEFNTRKVNGKDYGYTMKVYAITNQIAISLKGRTTNTAPEAPGTEYLFTKEGEEQVIDGVKYKFLGTGTNMEIDLKNDTKNITLEPNEWTDVDGKKYMNTLSFGSIDHDFARISTDGITSVKIPNNKYNINPKFNNTSDNIPIYDLRGRIVSYLNPNDIAKKVMSQNSAGKYIIKLPNNKSLVETKTK